jgi:hypothetical protein
MLEARTSKVSGCSFFQTHRGKVKFKPYGLIACGCVLVFGLGLILYKTLRRVPEPSLQARIYDAVPSVSAAELPKCAWVEEEIAATPEIKRAVDELLNFEGAALITYTKGEDRVPVCVAYLKPGTRSQRLISVHTPDVCWVGNGWDVRRRESRVSLAARGEKTPPPAEWREMRLADKMGRVLFWHLVGGQARDLSPPIAPWYSFLDEIISGWLQQREEQFFIRLSLNRPVAGWETQVVALVVQHLRAVGVPL